MRSSIAAAFALTMLPAACGKETTPPPPEPERAEAALAPAPTEVPPEAGIAAPAGDYRLDKSHASLIFTVNHVTYSNYTGSFDDFDATLLFDPSAPETMSVSATIDVGSLDIPAPPDGFLETLHSAEWLDAVGHPQMAFRSTNISLTSPKTAKVQGELTFRGVTAPVFLEATFNGGYAGFPPYDPNARIGFSAKGSLARSSFGLVAGLPTAEFPVGVGDDVTFEIEAEFIGPPTPQ